METLRKGSSRPRWSHTKTLPTFVKGQSQWVPSRRLESIDRKERHMSVNSDGIVRLCMTVHANSDTLRSSKMEILFISNSVSQLQGLSRSRTGS